LAGETSTTEEDHVQIGEAATTGAELTPGQRPMTRAGLPGEITIDDPNELASALALTEGELDDLRDPFIERFADIQRSSIGRSKVSSVRTDSMELFD
jgi:hypothetical protein